VSKLPVRLRTREKPEGARRTPARLQKRGSINGGRHGPAGRSKTPLGSCGGRLWGGPLVCAGPHGPALSLEESSPAHAKAVPGSRPKRGPRTPGATSGTHYHWNSLRIPPTSLCVIGEYSLRLAWACCRTANYAYYSTDFPIRPCGLSRHRCNEPGAEMADCVYRFLAGTGRPRPDRVRGYPLLHRGCVPGVRLQRFNQRARLWTKEKSDLVSANTTGGGG